MSENEQDSMRAV